MKLPLIILAVLILTVGIAAAHPTTGAAAGVTSNAATVSMNGAATICWFEWGQLSGNLSWKTPNQTSAGGVSSYKIHGSPLNGNTLFYYRACDTTGCGSELTFTTAAITPMPTTTYTGIFNNITENGFDPQYIAGNAVAPYFWLIPGFESIVWFLIFFPMFLGLWLTGRGFTIPVLIGLLAGGFLLTTQYPLFGMTLPAGFASMSQGIMYASLAGVIMNIIKK